MNRWKRVYSLLVMVAMAAGFTGCQNVNVQPWEKGLLADYTMRADRDKLHDAMSEHIYFSREASSGGRGVGASGCGCN